MQTTGRLPHSDRQADRRAYQLLYLGCFPMFFLAALAARMLPSRRHPSPAAIPTSRSILGEARAAADASLPFAMMN